MERRQVCRTATVRERPIRNRNRLLGNSAGLPVDEGNSVGCVPDAPSLTVRATQDATRTHLLLLCGPCNSPVQ